MSETTPRFENIVGKLVGLYVTTVKYIENKDIIKASGYGIISIIGTELFPPGGIVWCFVDCYNRFGKINFSSNHY